MSRSAQNSRSVLMLCLRRLRDSVVCELCRQLPVSTLWPVSLCAQPDSEGIVLLPWDYFG